MPIISGCRCPRHNFAEGGKLHSAHVTGWGADIGIWSDRKRFLILRAALALGIRRVGISKSFVHLDKDPTLPDEVAWVY